MRPQFSLRMFIAVVSMGSLLFMAVSNWCALSAIRQESMELDANAYQRRRLSTEHEVNLLEEEVNRLATQLSNLETKLDQ